MKSPPPDYLNDTQLLDNLFGYCFRAYHDSGRTFPGFKYDPFVNYIYLPIEDLPTTLYNFLHEHTHAQLNNGVLGLALYTTHKMVNHLEDKLMSSLLPVVRSLSRGTEPQRLLARYLFLHEGRQPESWSTDELRATIGSDK